MLLYWFILLSKHYLYGTRLSTYKTEDFQVLFKQNYLFPNLFALYLNLVFYILCLYYLKLSYIFQGPKGMAFKKINGYIIHLKQIIGKGSYGQVYRGQQQNTHKICAIKVITKSLIYTDEYLKSALIQEIQILQQVKSKNIVAVYQVMESTNNYYIIQQLCDSDLEKFMKTDPQITERKAIHILKQIANGFVALVKEGIIHRDVKPANILIVNDEIKIADFGFAKRNATQKTMNETTVGSPLYMSLQLLKGEPYSSKCDVWGLGLIFYQLLHNKTPWTAKTAYELIKCIQKNPLQINSSLNPDTQDFIRKTLAFDQQDRLEWDQVFDHPIFEGYFDHYRLNRQKIEDHLKVIMNNLRFKINSENIDINKLFNLLGFQAGTELSFDEFHKFLNCISPGIARQQVKYIFDRVDEDGNDKISMYQIQKQMNRHNINMEQGNIRQMEVSVYPYNEESKELTQQLAEKVKKCFQRLHRVLNSKQISLKKTFQVYDKQGLGNLSFQSFKNMMTRLDSQFTQEDLISIFDIIDTDHSKTIQYQKLNVYYSKVNGLPSCLVENESVSINDGYK